MVYASGVVHDRYIWDEHSYDTVAANGLGWQAVQEILLYTTPRVRSHIGALLRVAAPDRDGRWIVVTCIEEQDNEYLVVSARFLEPDEAADAARMIEGGGA